jgi:riboflavin synthase
VLTHVSPVCLPRPLAESRAVRRPARARLGGCVTTALFTGLVQGTAEVVSFDDVGDFARLKLKFPPKTLDGILIGASVACNGTCLTVVETEGDTACFDLIVETLRATNLGELVPGSSVNYERSARVGDEIGGHTVSGHVHAKATIVEQEDTENNRRVVFELDEKWSKYILPKGFVAVDGCSLTVGETSPGRFNVWLIPETIRQTVFANKDVGSTVNIEIESQTQTIVDTIERVLAEKEREKMEAKMAKKERKEAEKAMKKMEKMEKKERKEEEKAMKKKDKKDKKMDKEGFCDDD